MDDKPFTTPPTPLDPAWIDYNGHLNMAYYHVLFDRAIDLAFAGHGFDADYRSRTGATWFTVEAHVRYLAEVPPDALVTVAIRLAGHDAKRILLFEELRDAASGMLHASCEQLLLHVDSAARKVTPFGPDARARLAAWAAAETGLPPIHGLGRRIALPDSKS